MPAVAMTDHGNMFGSVEFYQAMKKAGIKPIIGCESYLLTKGSHTTREVRPDGGYLSHITLLAKNQAGYVNLCRLSSIAHLEGFYYKPRIDKELLAAHSEGIICLTGCLNGEISNALRNDDIRSARTAAEWLLKTFGEENVFFEIMRHGLPIQEKVNEGIIKLAREYSRPLVATNDCHYCSREDSATHDALLCIQTGKQIDDDNRMKMDTDNFYFRSPDEMKELFSDLPEAIESTLAIAEMCNVEFDFDTYHFPNFEAPAGKTLDTLLREESFIGLDKHWDLIVQQAPKDKPANREEYEARLNNELECIINMGFSGYFLIVADFIRHAKQEGIPVGPGRGSAAGSLVAYSLSITDIDPIPFKLYFERFLNPERVSMPDMDIDFCMRRRDEVIQYVQEKYGHVGQIITFGKMKAKAAIRDVARVMGINYGEADRISKMIPNQIGITLAEAIELEPELKKLAQEQEHVARLLETAQALEGFPRHASTHAAGVVMSDRPLTNFLPLYRGSRGEIVTQFDMKCVEKIGLIKFDFLGLKTLTILYDAIKIIEERHGNKINLETLPLDDQQVYAMLSVGDTAGVFQLESSGITELVTRLKPSLFEDIVALVALYRPGPLGSGMVDDFINRKHERTAIEYALPELENILKDTYGVILYQEQVMQIARILGNYTLGSADLLRRAMGKKNPEEMAQQKVQFLQGTDENKIARDKAEYIFDLMEKFAGYGFNKAHSAAYALVSYHTAYFKTHYPVEFFCSMLTNEMGNTEKVLQYLNDAKLHKLTVLPPDVNECEGAFKVVSNNEIRFGLAAVKNVGEGAIESIVESRREGAPFTDLFNFCERVDSRRVNKRVVESLIKCGAFDSLNIERSTLWATINIAMEHGAARQRERDSGQESLFSGVDTPSETPAYVQVEAWNETDKLIFEKESLGFYITGHPLAQFSTILNQCTTARTDTVKNCGDKKEVRIGGVVAAMKTITTKRGDPMAFVTLEDLFGTIELVVFSDVYQEVRELLSSDKPIFVTGNTDVNEESAKVLASRIVPLEEAALHVTDSVHLHFPAASLSSNKLTNLKKLLGDFVGHCPVYLHLVIPDQSETIMQLPSDTHVAPTMELADSINNLFGEDVTRFTCKPPAPQEQQRGRRRRDQNSQKQSSQQ